MATIAVEKEIESSRPRLVAPRWHTVLLISLFLAFNLSSLVHREAHSDPGKSLQNHLVPLYLSLIAMEWGLFLYVWYGLHRRGTKLREMIGGRWRNARDVAVDASLAFGLWAAWLIVEELWDHWLGLAHAASIQTLSPQRTSEILLWIGVSVSAGICEELVFRGYFQRQFEVFTRNKRIALFLQAALFGILHHYQGLGALKIGIFSVVRFPGTLA